MKVQAGSKQTSLLVRIAATDLSATYSGSRIGISLLYILNNKLQTSSNKIKQAAPDY
jgi:hypothetical protein